MMKRPHAELLEKARAQISFPLACYLIAAEEGSHFCYSWGYTSAHGMLDSYPELDRRLGPPEGPAEWDEFNATRQFQHASVSIDLNQKKGRIDWLPK